MLRRDFMKLCAGLAGLLLVVPRALAELVKVDDPTAKALGYIVDASKTDIKKYPKRDPKKTPGAEKQFCYNCLFYKATGDAKASKQAPCTIFTNKEVLAKAWCNSWAQNPAVKG